MEDCRNYFAVLSNKPLPCGEAELRKVASQKNPVTTRRKSVTGANLSTWEGGIGVNHRPEEMPVDRGGGGEGLVYKKVGGSRRLAWGCKFQLLVSLGVLRKNHKYSEPSRSLLGLHAKKCSKERWSHAQISLF